MAIDWGEKKIGISLSDPSGILVTPFPYIENKNRTQSIKEIEKLIRENDVFEIVFGIPKDMKGEIGEKAKQYKEIGEKIEKDVKIPVKFFDERYTTQLANRILRLHPKKKTKRKELKDSLSASILLESCAFWTASIPL